MHVAINFSWGEKYIKVTPNFWVGQGDPESKKNRLQFPPIIKELWSSWTEMVIELHGNFLFFILNMIGFKEYEYHAGSSQ